MGLSGPQKALCEMIIASDFPACIVNLLFLHQSEISERALFRPLTNSSTLLPMICSVVTSDRVADLSALKATHEEEDTGLILHCVNNSLDNIVVLARDTDVTLLLVAHVPHILCTKLYMMSGTATKEKYFNIRDIYENLPASLLPFHALRGCDTTSFI